MPRFLSTCWRLDKVPFQNKRFAPTASRYNRAFDLAAVGERVGYPAYMKPFRGGGWVNVYRIADQRAAAAR